MEKKKISNLSLLKVATNSQKINKRITVKKKSFSKNESQKLANFRQKRIKINCIFRLLWEFLKEEVLCGQESLKFACIF